MSAPTRDGAAPTATRDEPGFDATLLNLKQVVEKLESGQLSLEASLASFEEGVRLARIGAQILDAAERRVEILSRGEGGAPSIAEMADPHGGDSTSDGGTRR